jgi:hypothetical protein
MPRATAQIDDTVRKDLKTLPEGFVVLRRLTFGQMLQRREMLKLTMSKASGSKDFVGEMAMASSATTIYEFRHCIVEHNLEDDNGQLLNFANERDFQRLDPKVGQEIEKYIGDLNNFDEEDEQGN